MDRHRNSSGSSCCYRDHVEKVTAVMQKKRRVPPILWTILYVVVLASLGATSDNYRHTADLILGGVELVAALVLTVLGVRAYWSYWRHRESDDPGFRLLRSWRRWMRDEKDRTLLHNL